MKILIGYPPTESKKGIATLGQNRQFQWFSNPSFFYPVIMSTASTMLKQKGHEVKWIDCIAEKISWSKFIKIIKKEKPDLFIFETKTPVVKQHWKTTNKLKENFPDMKIAIVGDHVTALPQETMENSKADFVICGGDFDFMTSDLVDWLEKKVAQYTIIISAVPSTLWESLLKVTTQPCHCFATSPCRSNLVHG